MGWWGLGGGGGGGGRERKGEHATLHPDQLALIAFNSYHLPHHAGRLSGTIPVERVELFTELLLYALTFSAGLIKWISKRETGNSSVLFFTRF